MPDMKIKDGTGQEVLDDITAELKSLSSWYAGDVDPAAAGYSEAYMWWRDLGNSLIKQRNAGNTQWITKGKILSNGTIEWFPTFGTLSSASQMMIGANDNEIIAVTGSSPIASFDAINAGVKRSLIFRSSVTITHSSSAIILPGNTNINASAGDVLQFVSEGNGIWRCISYLSASGIGTSGNSQGNSKTIFLINGTYTVPSGVTTIYISGCGAGAGGSSCATGAGGGGGMSVFRRAFSVSPGDVVTISIGTGGAGATYYSYSAATYTYSSSTMDGKDGGDTTISINGTVVLTLSGGKGSVANNTTSAYAFGQKGGEGATDGTSISMLDTNRYAGGKGGDSLFGTGGKGGYSPISSISGDWTSAGNGIGFGAGGGGAAWLASGSGFYVSKTGNGTNGIVVIEVS